MSQCVKLFQEKATRDISTGVLQVDMSSLPALPGAGRASVYGETRGEVEGLWVFAPGYGNIFQQVKQWYKEDSKSSRAGGWLNLREREFRIDRRATRGVIKWVKHLNRFPKEIAKSLLEDASGPTWLVEVRGELPGHHSGYARFVVSCLSCLL